MGLLSKLFGSGAPDPGLPATSPASMPPNRLRLSCSGRVPVVGESNYQPALKQAAGGAGSESYAEGIPVQASLVAEPSNKYDSNAVRVDVDGRTVGYLARELAREYQPVLQRLSADGAQAWCDARILGGGERSYGIFLHLAGPDLIGMANSCDGLELLVGDRIVTVAKRQDHQNVLASFVEACPRLPVSVYTTLALASISGGKHVDRDTLEVRLDGSRVGELTMGMAVNYLPIFRPVIAAGGVPGCEAVIDEEKGGLGISLRLPMV